MGPMVLVLPVFLCILDSVELKAVRGRVFRFCLCLAMSFIMYGNAQQVLIDQFAMQQGRTATMTLAEEMLHSLNDLGYLNPDTPVCISGDALWNPMAHVDLPFKRANHYAQYGAGVWPDPVTAMWERNTWEAIFREALGISVKMCDLEEYERLFESKEVQAMPVYPAEGSIAMMDNGIVVIKISEMTE